MPCNPCNPSQSGKRGGDHARDFDMSESRAAVFFSQSRGAVKPEQDELPLELILSLQLGLVVLAPSRSSAPQFPSDTCTCKQYQEAVFFLFPFLFGRLHLHCSPVLRTEHRVCADSMSICIGIRLSARIGIEPSR